MSTRPALNGPWLLSAVKALARTRGLLALALYVALCGFTDCAYFSTVTVPSSDGTRPHVFGGVYDANNGYAPAAQNGSSVEFDAPTYNSSYYLYGSGVDAGGTRRVDMELKVQVMCCDDDAICFRNFHQTTEDFTQTQSGGVGQRVSNGVFAGRLFKPKETIESVCTGPLGPPGPEDMIKATWSSTASDFHGNSRSGGQVTFYYNWQGPR